GVNVEDGITPAFDACRHDRDHTATPADVKIRGVAAEAIAARGGRIGDRQPEGTTGIGGPARRMLAPEIAAASPHWNGRPRRRPVERHANVAAMAGRLEAAARRFLLHVHLTPSCLTPSCLTPSPQKSSMARGLARRSQPRQLDELPGRRRLADW